MRVLVVRHGCAGDKRYWVGHDAERPLDTQGHRQAEALVDALSDRPLRRIVSSPTARCVDTVVPVGRARGLPVEQDGRLGHSTPGDEFLALATKPEYDDAVLCTHGEVMRGVLTCLREWGTPIEARDPDDDHLLLAKGSGWELDVEGGEVMAVRHFHPDPGLDCLAHPPSPTD